MTAQPNWNGDINVAVSLDAPALSRAGFTTLLILGSTTSGYAAGEVKQFTGPPSTSEADELGAALTARVQAAFKQTQRPRLVKVGNLAAYTDAGLDAIWASDSDWFGLVVESRTKADILAVASWIEAKQRMFLAQASDADIYADAYSASEDPADLGNALRDKNYAWTGWCWHHSDTEYPDVSAMANRLSINPDNGTTYWRHFSMVEVTSSHNALTETQRSNILSKNGNLVLPFGDVATFGPGRLVNGRPFDLQVTAAWTKERVNNAIARLFRNTSERGSKVPFDDDGFATIQNAVLEVLLRGVRVGHFTAANPAHVPQVVMPSASDISIADQESRTLTFSFFAKPAGAVETVTINGNVNLDWSGVAT